MLDASQENPKAQYDILLRELEAYNPELLGKPKIVVLNKADLVEPSVIDHLKNAFPTDVVLLAISALMQENLQSLKDLLSKQIAPR